MKRNFTGRRAKREDCQKEASVVAVSLEKTHVSLPTHAGKT